MGGTAGLFLGASILSLVELPYFLIIRGCQKAMKKENVSVAKSGKRKGWRELINGIRFPNMKKRLTSVKGKFGVKKIKNQKRVIQPYKNNHFSDQSETSNYRTKRWQNQRFYMYA